MRKCEVTAHLQRAYYHKGGRHSLGNYDEPMGSITA